MKNTIKLFLLFAILHWNNISIQAQNISLDFDGDYDFLSANANIPNNDFTIETWFLSADPSTSQNCIGNFKRLFAFSGGSTMELGICGGALNFYWIDDLSNIQGFIPLSTTLYNDNNWHHIAISRTGQNIEIFLDCVSTGVYPIIGGLTFTDFRIGHWPGGITIGEDWIGRVDDFRIWDYGKTLQEVIDEKSCVLTGSENDLQVYYNFDEGVSNGTNTSIPVVPDLSGGNDATFSPFVTNNPSVFGFELLPEPSPTFGNVSNYINSNAPLAYPNLNNLDIEIRDYPYRNNLLTEICNGDPAHFTLLNNGIVPGPFSNIPVQWFYDDGAGPVTLISPPFSDFRFGVPQGEILYDCNNSTDGFVDRTFYAVSSVTAPGSTQACDYKSKDYDLRICCPISPATVSISPPDPLCEGETVTVNVCLNSPDLFVQTPGQYVDIEWYYDGTYVGFTDQTCFNYTLTAPLVTSPQSLCFEAEVSNCNGKIERFQSCLTVDPEPICGSIIGWPVASPMNITLVSTTPHLIYEICPENDAQVGQDPTDPFIDCIPQWQYSYDCTTWFDLGFSNTVQNTNVIPTSAWPGNQIFYQVQCNPLSNPSGCDPCFSNKIEIRLPTPPIANSISGPNQLCNGDQNTLTVTTPDPTHTYTWFCDGLQVGTGTSYSYTANQSACYWLESADGLGCYVVESSQHCVEVCDVEALLSCPLVPNDCACLGDPITLSACDSFSTCSPSNLSFTWYIDGVIQSNTACTITDTPPAGGATYKVEVIDLNTGCMGMTERTVVPCDKDN